MRHQFPALLLAATLTWTAGAIDADHAPPLAFTIERALSGCAAPVGWVVLTNNVDPAATSYVDTTTQNNQPYCYRMKATNNAGASEYSNLAPFAPPQPPSGVVAK